MEESSGGEPPLPFYLVPYESSGSSSSDEESRSGEPPLPDESSGSSSSDEEEESEGASYQLRPRGGARAQQEPADSDSTEYEVKEKVQI